MKPFEIILFEYENGDTPVADFLKTLNPQAKAKMYREIGQLLMTKVTSL